MSDAHGLLPEGQTDYPEVVYGAWARAEALAAGDPDWVNCKRWPKESDDA